ncbi:hypothetical protein ACOMHN_005326 [Nucella lapillus]
MMASASLPVLSVLNWRSSLFLPCPLPSVRERCGPASPPPHQLYSAAAWCYSDTAPLYTSATQQGCGVFVATCQRHPQPTDTETASSLTDELPELSGRFVD